MSWDSDSLLQKAKLFIFQAQKEDREGPLFALWLTLALELLGRAALARVHPLLLADPRNPDNVYYAIGQQTKGSSVAAVTVFRRCRRIVPTFTEQDLEFVLALMDRRNEELHSGALAFENWPTRAWLAGYYRVCSVLAAFLGLDLPELFGQAEAGAASAMIEADARRTEVVVADRIAAVKSNWDQLTPEERSAAAIRGKGFDGRYKPTSIRERCPACHQVCWLSGEVVAELSARADEDEIVRDIVVLPTTLACGYCGLELSGYGQLHAAGFGGQYTVTSRSDPVEYYNIDWRDFDIDVDELIRERYGEDYGNE